MFAGYREIEIAGEGGLGRVYRAIRESTGGVVAIKELREVASASPVWHRARRELEAMLRLKGHPFVVSVEELFDGPHGPCIVMEFLDGGSLIDRVRHGPLAVQELLLVGQHVTQALGAAHDVGIVHRDVKPHNLLIGSFGQIKVADFGIAALTREAGLHTRTQSFTLAYASPEELDGDSDVGPPTDAYSFAATMLHLATATKPSFTDRSSLTQLDALATRHPAIGAVAAAMRDCLQTDPTRRPTMGSLQAVFEKAIVQLGDHRITRLGPPGTTTDPPIPVPVIPSTPAPVLPPIAPQRWPSVVPAAPVVPVIQQMTHHRAPEPTAYIAANTVMRPTPRVPTQMTGSAPGARQTAPVLPTPAGPQRRTALLIGIGCALIALAGIGIATVLITGGGSSRAATAAAPVTDPADELAGLATTVATTLAPTPTTAIAPVTLPPATLPPVTLPPATLPPVTLPPPTTSVPTQVTLSAQMATDVFGEYMALAAQRYYPEAWAMLTSRYQVKYLGYESFVNFWEGIEGNGIRAARSIGQAPGEHSLELYVWFGRRSDGSISNEVVEVVLIVNPFSGDVMIDDYRYVREG